jgi:hypothetical protein
VKANRRGAIKKSGKLIAFIAIDVNSQLLHSAEAIKPQSHCKNAITFTHRGPQDAALPVICITYGDCRLNTGVRLFSNEAILNNVWVAVRENSIPEMRNGAVFGTFEVKTSNGGVAFIGPKGFIKIITMASQCTVDPTIELSDTLRRIIDMIRFHNQLS